MDARLLTDAIKIALHVPMTDDPEPDLGLPIDVSGPPGGAKSSAVRAAADESALPHVNMSPGRIGEGGFGTIAVPATDAEGRMFLDAPPRRHLLGLHAGVIILDDRHLAPQGLHPAMMGLVLDRMIGDYRLPGRVRVVQTSNRASDTPNALQCDPAHANRVCHLEATDPTPSALVAHLRSRSNRQRGVTHDHAQIEIMVRERFGAAFDRALDALDAALRVKPSILRTQPEDCQSPEASGPWASPRSWDMGMRAWATCHALADVMPQAARVAGALLTGCVGSAAADMFVDVQARGEIPDPRALLDGSVTWRPDPSRPDVIDTVADRVVEWTIGLPVGAERTAYGHSAWTFLGRLGQAGARDCAAAGARRLLVAQVGYGPEHMAELAHLLAWVAQAEVKR